MKRYLNISVTFLFCWSLAMLTYAGAGDLQEFRENPSPPPLVLKDIHGQQHSLEDYRGKVVLVNFWAGWCHPCIQEIPEMIRLAEMLADRPFVILAVNVGEEQRKLPGFVKRMDEHMVILMDTDSKAFKRWKGIGLPSTFVIDPGGQIRYEAYGAVNWDAPYIVTMLTDLMDKTATETAASADNN
jgi:thiol-disulfide isomerase/thioredoxin